MRKPKRSKIFLLLGLASVASLVGVFVWNRSGRNASSPATARETADRFLHRFVSADYSSAYDLMTEDQQAGSSREEFARRLKQYGIEGHKETAHANTRSSGSVKELTYDVLYAAAKQSVRLWLIEDGSEWRIYIYEIDTVISSGLFFTIPTLKPTPDTPIS